MATTDRQGDLLNETRLGIKAPCLVATTGPITLIGIQAIDGVTVGNNGERVLVKDQADQTQNGIYLASSGNWTRALGAASNTDWAQGTLVITQTGATNAEVLFSQMAAGPVIIGETDVAFGPLPDIVGPAGPQGPAGPSGSVANPTALVGLTAVNGSATTAIRSDGAPALNQSIVPTWTGKHTFSAGADIAPGLLNTPKLTFGDAFNGFFRPAVNMIGAGINGNRIMHLDGVNFNTSIGYGALGAGPSSGQYNVALGYLAGANITTGSYNFALGGLALNSLTAGNGNIGIGWQALEVLTTGPLNIAIGHAAGAHMTTATQNIAIGAGALTNAIDSTDCIAIGVNALATYTTGGTFNGNQVAIGVDALFACTTGYESVAVGTSALGLSTTGFWNTAVGIQCMQFVTTGNQNSAYGLSALSLLTTGTLNAAIGINAGTANGTTQQAIDSNSCTFLGSVTGQATTATRDHLTVIGANALGVTRDSSITLGRLGTDVVYAGETVLGPNSATLGTGAVARTVATLPAASAALKGARSFVTDATGPTFLGTLTGSGSVVCPVFCNGTAWVAG